MWLQADYRRAASHIKPLSRAHYLDQRIVLSVVVYTTYRKSHHRCNELSKHSPACTGHRRRREPRAAKCCWCVGDHAMMLAERRETRAAMAFPFSTRAPGTQDALQKGSPLRACLPSLACSECCESGCSLSLSSVYFGDHVFKRK